MADWAVVNGYACYDCGFGRCRCESLEQEMEREAREDRIEHRTNRLMLAIDLVEAKIARIEDENENHPALPELRERLNNLTRSLLNHRRLTNTEIY